jgi:Ca2+-binding EF-hand superfamily protein
MPLEPSAATQNAAMQAERHKIAAQTAENLAERYRDPVAKLKEEQATWRRKHDALVRRKTREMEKLNMVESDEALPAHIHVKQPHDLDLQGMLQLDTPSSFPASTASSKRGSVDPTPAGSALASKRASIETATSRSSSLSYVSRPPPRHSQLDTGLKNLKPIVHSDSSPMSRHPSHSSINDASRHDGHYTASFSEKAPGHSPRSSHRSDSQRFGRSPTDMFEGRLSGSRQGSKESISMGSENERRNTKRRSTVSRRRTASYNESDQVGIQRSHTEPWHGPAQDGGDEDHHHVAAPGNSKEAPRSPNVLNSLKGKKSMLAGRRHIPQDDNIDFNQVVQVAKNQNLSVDEVHEKMKDFMRFDKAGNGFLSMEEFEATVRKVCNVDADAKTPEHLLTRHWQSVDQDMDGKVSFEEYVVWSMEVAYSEEVLVPDAGERLLRHLAREHGFAITEVERIKQIFDEFDTDKSGVIEQEEFFNVIMKLMKVKNPRDVSKKKLERYWAEADTDHSGEITFEEYLLWYTRCAGSEL